MNKITTLPFLLLAVCSCSSLTKVSGRYPNSPEGKEMALYKHPGASRPEERQPAQIFTKKKTFTIVPMQKDNAGSLYNLHDENNNLFGDNDQPRVGKTISVKINPAKTNAEAEKVQPPAGDGVKPEGESKDEPKAAAAPEDQDLLKAFPALAPPEKDKSRVLKQIKMRIANRFPNGDFLLVYERQSLGIEEQNDIVLKARVPVGALVGQKEVTTEMLTDISLRQRVGDEVVERVSVAWEDEYALRISGFDEVKSKRARKIEEDRKELEKVRVKMQERIQSLGSERSKIAAERDRLKKIEEALPPPAEEEEVAPEDGVGTTSEIEANAKKSTPGPNDVVKPTTTPGQVSQGQAKAGGDNVKKPK